MENFFTVNLPNKVKVKALGNQEVEIDKIEIHEFIDSPIRKTVTAICRNHPVRILLWEGDAYDAIGDWTNADVEFRVKEIYS